MITLHRIGHCSEPFQLNPDTIVTVESTPDTVVTLATACKVVVDETPDEVAEAIRAWRVDVLAEALRAERPDRRPARITAPPRRALAIEGMPRTADHRGR